MEYSDRIEKATAYFKSGYNCAQSVLLAFADIYNLDKETALHVAASFGAGTGRMRMTCGAASGMFILAGLEKAAIDPADKESKAENYKLVQQLANKFKEENGTLICGELLGLRKDAKESYIPQERTAEYYAKRPCERMVECAARIFADYLENKKENAL